MRSARMALLGFLLCSACRQDASASRGTAVVFAAASLAGAFEEMRGAFVKAHPDARVEIAFAGTSQLVAQLERGAQADVFASADEANMAKVAATGLVTGTPRRFAENRLALVFAAGNPKRVQGLADLAREDLVVVLCAPQVPAGTYARSVLAKSGVVARAASEEPSVKAVVGKVALGEADVGIVYATDVREGGSKIAGIELPSAQNVVAHYPIAELSCGRNGALGHAFVEFVLSAEGRAILAARGFGSP